KVREQLLQRQQMLEARADKTTRDASHRDEAVSADFAEQATERENDDVLRTISVEARYEIQQIGQALQRIEDGNYGECSGCGAEIGSEWPPAVPCATSCMNCARGPE